MNPNEMLRLLQKYIYDRKKVKVGIAIRTKDDIQKLQYAYNVAVEYYNGTKIIIG